MHTQRPLYDNKRHINKYLSLKVFSYLIIYWSAVKFPFYSISDNKYTTFYTISDCKYTTAVNTTAKKYNTVNFVLVFNLLYLMNFGIE